MSKFFSWVLMVICGTFLLGNFVLATTTIDMSEQVAKQAGYTVTGVTDTTLSENIGKIIRLILSFTGTLFLALTIYAGILWMTASGNEEQVTKATGIIKMAVIGLIICMAAYSITYFIVNRTTDVTTNNPGQVGGVQ